MNVRKMPQMVIRVSPKSKEWVKQKAEEEKRSQNFIVNWALEKIQELENAKAANNNQQA